MRSNDPEFVAKAAEIVGLYMGPPENAVVLSIDEKPSIQALERVQGCQTASNSGSGAILMQSASTALRKCSYGSTF